MMLLRISRSMKRDYVNASENTTETQCKYSEILQLSHAGFLWHLITMHFPNYGKCRATP